LNFFQIRLNPYHAPALKMRVILFFDAVSRHHGNQITLPTTQHLAVFVFNFLRI